MRVYELAKKLNQTSKDIMDLLRHMAINIKSHMSNVSDDIVKQVINHLCKLTEQEKKKANNQSQTVHITKSKQKTRSSDSLSKTATKQIGQIDPDVNLKDQSTKENIRELTLTFPLTVGELARSLDIKANELIKKLMKHNVFASINQSISRELVENVLLDYNCLLKEKNEPIVSIKKENKNNLIDDVPDKAEYLETRSAIVTLMGHVDHGKTSLLDVLRSTNVTSKEIGGITQHIGAYEVITDHGKVTFIDTPGHQAFTAMRVRGSQITDIVVLVVAADDGVKPQTIEAINHAKAANVPIIVAINKCDKPNADPQRVRTQLTQYDLVDEKWGGQTIFVDISAHTKQGLDLLIEMLILESEMLELKANPKRKARGVVLESYINKHCGIVATLMVTTGTLKIGDIVMAQKTYGKVRALINHQGKKLLSAGPSTPVEVWGLHEVAYAGDMFMVVPSEKQARLYQDKLIAQQKEKLCHSTKKIVTLEDFYSHIKQGKIKEFNLILKCDNTGSIEALGESLLKLNNDKVSLKIIHQAVGMINESDIVLAKASHAIIIGFHVTANSACLQLAEREGVHIHLYNIIYEAIEQIKSAMQGVLDVKEIKRNIGLVNIQTIFKSSKIGTIAGCYVSSGKVQRGAYISLIRDKQSIGDDKILTLRREKDDVREVNEGYECGIVLDKLKDIQKGDVLQVYIFQKEKQLLT